MSVRTDQAIDLMAASLPSAVRFKAGSAPAARHLIYEKGPLSHAAAAGAGHVARGWAIEVAASTAARQKIGGHRPFIGNPSGPAHPNGRARRPSCIGGRIGPRRQDPDPMRLRSPAPKARLDKSRSPLFAYCERRCRAGHDDPDAGRAKTLPRLIGVGAIAGLLVVLAIAAANPALAPGWP